MALDQFLSTGMCPVGDNPFTQQQQQVSFLLTLADGGAAAVASELRFRMSLVETSTISATELTYKGSSSQKEDFARSVSEELLTSGIASAASVHFVSSTVNEHHYALLLTLSPEGLYNNMIAPPSKITPAHFTCFASSALVCSVAVRDNTQITISGTNAASKTYRIRVQEQPASAAATIVVSVDGGPYLTDAADILTMSSSVPLDISLAAGGSAGEVTALFPVTVGHTVGAVWMLFPTASGGVTSSHVVKPGVRENLVCGGVGKCDFLSGTCACPPGTTSQSCSQLDLQAERSKSQPIVDALASDLSFDGSVLNIRSTRTHGIDFDFITVSAADQPPVFQLRGDGRVSLQELHAKMGVTVGTGGLVVDNSGVSIRSGGVSLASHSSSNDLTLHDGMVTASSTNVNSNLYSFSSSVLSTAGKSVLHVSAPTSASVFSIATAKADGTTLFRVDGTGSVVLTEGNLAVDVGNVAVQDGYLTVSTTNAAETPAVLSGIHTAAVLESSGDGNSPSKSSTLLVQAKNGVFAGNVASIIATRSASSGFSFLQVASDGGSTSHVEVDGTGQLRSNSGARIDQGLTVVNGGLHVPTSNSILMNIQQTNEAGGVSVLGHYHQHDALGTTPSTFSVDVFGEVSIASQEQVKILGSESAINGGADILLSAGATSTSRDAGSVHIRGGESSSSSRPGGSVLLQTTDIPAGVATAAGHVSLLPGSVTPTGSVSGVAGSIVLSAGANLKSGGVNPGGGILLLGGQADTGRGGAINIVGGSASSAGAIGGAVSVVGGDATAAGGDLIFHAGNAATHGKVDIWARDAATSAYVSALAVNSDGSVDVSTASGKQLRLQPGTSATQTSADQHILSGNLGGTLFLSSPLGQISSTSKLQNTVASDAGPVLLSSGSVSSPAAEIELVAHSNIQLTAGYTSNVGSIQSTAATDSQFTSKSGFLKTHSESGHTSILVGSVSSATAHKLFMGADPTDSTAVTVEMRAGKGSPAGGSVQIQGGEAASATSSGGSVSVIGAAAGGGSANGGSVVLVSGSGVAGGGNGGDINILTGGGMGGRTAGNIVLSTGSSANGQAGQVNIFSGNSLGGSASGDAGAILLSAGGSTASPANSAGGSISVVLGKGVNSDGKLVLQNAAHVGTGNFALSVLSGSTSIGGGDVSIDAGADGTGGSLGLTSALGGNIKMLASAASGTDVGSMLLSSGSGIRGGSVSLVSGASSAANPSGSVIVSTAGTSSTLGTPGSLSLVVGESTVTSKAAGHVIMSAGVANGGGAGVLGGAVSILGGEASSNTAVATAGTVTIQGGSNTGTAASRAAGDVLLRGGRDLGGSSHGKVEVQTYTGVAALTVTTGLTSLQGSSTEISATGGELSLFTAASGSHSLKVLAGQGASGLNGAQLELRAGSNTGGNGGSVILSAGEGSGASGAAGGDIEIISGLSSDTSGTSGHFLLSTADPAATGDSGSFSIISGKATVSHSGSVLISTGNGLATAAAGHVSILAGSSSAAAGGSIVMSVGDSSSAADGQFTLLDAGGQSVVQMSTSSLVLQQNTIHLLTTQQGMKLESHDGTQIQLLAGSASASSGGDLIAYAGDRSSAGVGGSVSIVAGRAKSASGTQTGGHVMLSSGAAVNSASSVAGHLSVMGGSGMAQGGSIKIVSGSAATNGVSGNLLLSVSPTTGTGVAGQFSLVGGSSAAGQAGSIVLLPGTASSGTNGRVTLKSANGRDPLIIFDDQMSLKSGAVSLETDADNLSLLAQEGKTLQLFGEDSVAGQGAHAHLRSGSGGTAGAISIISGSGTTAAGAITLSAGGVTSASSAGGSIFLSAGDSSNTVGSQGGHVVLAGGKSSYNNGPTGTGGHISLMGGESTDNGQAGTINLHAGVCSNAGFGCTGGDIQLSAGKGSAATNHGKLLLVSASGTVVLSSDADASRLKLFESRTDVHASTELRLYTDDSSSTTAGPVFLSAGNGLVNQAGGALSILAGKGVLAGGSISVLAGASSSENGGAVTIAGGETLAAKSGGSVFIKGGSSVAAGSSGGHVSILSGTGIGSDGDVVLQASGSGSTKVVSSGGHDTLVADPNETKLTGLAVTVVATNGEVRIQNQLGKNIELGFLGNSAGSISLTAGESATSGGAVFIRGGTSNAGTAGNVELQPGASSSGVRGNVIVHSRAAGGVPALTINSLGSTYTSEVSTVVASAPGQLTLVRSGPAAVGTGAGGNLLLSAETTSGTGGTLSVLGGDGATAGSVALKPGTGTSPGRLILSEANGATAIDVSVGVTTLNANRLQLQSTGSGAGTVSIITGPEAGNSISLEAGSGSSGSEGGFIQLQAGASSSTLHPAGSIELAAGFSNRNLAGEVGGTISLKGGKSLLVGGPVLIQGGQSVNSLGGAVSILSGASLAGTAGQVTIAGSDAAGNGDGGHTSVRGGAGSGTGSGGSISMQAGTGTNDGQVRLESADGVSFISVKNSGLKASVTSAEVKSSTGSIVLQSAEAQNINLRSGDAAGSLGGSIIMNAGRATATEGGHVSIAAGDSTQATGGSLSLVAGAGGTSDSTGSGGVLNIRSGIGAGSSHAGGAMLVTSGAGIADAASGNLNIATGSAAGAGVSGTVVISSGSADNANSGAISIISGVSAQQASGAITLGTADTTGALAAGTIQLRPGRGASTALDATVSVLDARGAHSFKCETAHTELSSSNTVLVSGGGKVTIRSGTTGAGNIQLESAASSSILLSSAAAGGGSGGHISLVAGSGSSSGSVFLSSGSSTSTAGTLSVFGGESSGNAGNIFLSGGKATFTGSDAGLLLPFRAGSVSIVGGAAADNLNVAAHHDSAGGHVVLSGGKASGDLSGAIGGHVSIIAGTGVTDGKVFLRAPNAAVDGLVVADVATTMSGKIVDIATTTGRMQLESVNAQPINILAGGGASAVSGGDVLMRSGHSTGASQSGKVEIFTGQTSSTGQAAGPLLLSGGLATGPSGVGGHLSMLGGRATGSTATGGTIHLLGGQVQTGSAGGIQLSAGSSSTSGNAGGVSIFNGLSPSGNDGHILLSLASGSQNDGKISLFTTIEECLSLTAAKTQLGGPDVEIVSTGATGRLYVASAASRPLVVQAGHTGSTGGTLSLIAGNHGTANAANALLQGGAFSGSGAFEGGAVSILGGAAASGSAGGAVALVGGSSVSGGTIHLAGGPGTTTGGDVQLIGGTGISTSGHVSLAGGGGVAAGSVSIVAGSGSASNGHVSIHRVVAQAGSTLAFEATDVKTSVEGKDVVLYSRNAGTTQILADATSQIILSVQPSTASIGPQSISIIAGARAVSGAAAGPVVVQGGQAATFPTATGGQVSIIGGDSLQGRGGTTVVKGGTGAKLSSTGDGGSVSIVGGEAFARSGSATSGHVVVQSGATNAAVSSGSLSFTTVNAGAGAAAGNVRISLGSGTPDGEFEIFGADTASRLKIVSSTTTMKNGILSLQTTQADTGTITMQTSSASDAQILTGDASAANAGHILLSTGRGAASGTSSSGSVSILTGVSLGAPGNTGSLIFASGGSGKVSGRVSLHSGPASETTGSLHLSTGVVGANTGSDLQLFGSFPGNSAHGHVQLRAGSSSNSGGHISLLSGTGSGLSGSVKITVGAETSPRVELDPSFSRIGARTEGGSVSVLAQDASGSLLTLESGSPTGQHGSSVLIQAGQSTTAVGGGSISMLAGPSTTAQNGGSIVFRPGSSGSGTDGTVVIQNAAGTTVQTFGTTEWAVASSGSVRLTSADSQGMLLEAGGSAASTPAAGGAVQIKAEPGTVSGGHVEIQAGNGPIANGGNVVLQAGTNGAVQVKSGAGLTVLQATAAGAVELLADTKAAQTTTTTVEGKFHLLGNELTLPSSTTNPLAAYLDVTTPWDGTSIDVRTHLVIRLHRDGFSGADQLINVNCNHAQLVVVINDDLDDVLIARPGTCGAGASSIDRHRVLRNSVGLFFCSCP